MPKAPSSARSRKKPGRKAGLQSGDVFLEFNGKKVTDSRHLRLGVATPNRVRRCPSKSPARRVTKTMDITVREIGHRAVAKSESHGKDDNGTLNGVTVNDLDAQAVSNSKCQHIRGVIVSEVEARFRGRRPA
jgi:hypothetical protein